MPTIKDSMRNLAAQKAFNNKEPFKEIPKEEWNPHTAPRWMTRAFKSSHYMVMVNDHTPTTHGPAIRAMVQKHNDTPFINHWSEMQRIKNEIFGAESMAIEYYPPDSELIDHHNIYWMWIFPIGVIPKPI